MTADMTDQIIEIVESKGLHSFDPCRGQGYDGASTMSGAYGGVQKFIQDKQPLAVYVHCAEHNLNLVVNDAVSAVRDAQAFYHHAGTVCVLRSQHTQMGFIVIYNGRISSHTEEAQPNSLGWATVITYGH
jgi:hypothetical protein